MRALGMDLSFMTLMLLNGVVNLVLLGRQPRAAWAPLTRPAKPC